MYNNKAVFLAVAILTILSINKSFAQINVKTEGAITTKKSFDLSIGGGISNYLSSFDPPPVNLQGSISKTGFASTIRLMWHPGYLLGVGFESGYYNFFSYRIKNNNIDGKVSLQSIPLLVVFSMTIVKKVNVYAGFGNNLLTSTLEYNGSVKSKVSSLGSNIALSYTQPISKYLDLSAEAKWLSAFKTNDNLLSLQVLLIWRFLEY